MTNLNITVIDADLVSKLESVRASAEKYVEAEKLYSWKLPERAGRNNRYIVPISGGSDSSCLALVLRALFPSADFEYVFTDTKAESEDLYDNLAKLEEWLGIKIHRIVPKLGLFEYIEQYGGFLPSAKQRWCTPQLKIKPLDQWMEETFDLETDQVYTFVGIRADEGRMGFVSDNDAVKMVLPYVELGMGRTAVYGILSDTIGIAQNYKWNTRSSCFSCFNKRRSERVGQLVHRPEEFKLTMDLEKLVDSDLQRFNYEGVAKALHQSDLRRCNYYVPPAVDIRTSHLSYPPKPVKRSDDTIDMFDPLAGEDDFDEIYVAVALLVHPLMNMFGGSSPGVWNQELVSYSPTLAGLKKAMLFYFEHRLNTAEVWFGMTQDEVRERLKIALYQIRVPKGLVDLKRVADESYTWGTGEAYAQIEHHVRLVHNVLLIEGLRQQRSEHLEQQDRDDFEFTWEFEEVERIDEQLAKLAAGDLKGVVSWSGVFDPPPDHELPSEIKKLRLAKEAQEESKMGCIACSL